ncbi:MAG TPA: acyltransferase family protein [Trebonia sp.]|nr:acyltransferase family protein [Trebonia sp.]
MPKPVDETQRYLPGLDGLRAIAVAVVVAYHLGFGWAGGGLLGVGVFFTLSGYLITDILVGQWRSAGAINLKQFWIRRARRLLPALFTVLAVVAVWVTVGYPGELSTVRGDTVAAALYVSNWWFIAQNASYFSRFGPPSPITHLWSLAVEEQFYLIWPWVVLVGCIAARRVVTTMATKMAPGQELPRTRWAGVSVTLLLAVASFVALEAAFHPGLDPTRAYEGTDTRAGGLLVGAALAIGWPTRRTVRRANCPLMLDAAGVLGLAVIGVMIWRTTEYSAFMFRGGMVVLSAATAMVIAAVVHPRSRLGRVLGIGPLRWIGVWSYGIYLWHYPLIVLTAPGGNPEAQPIGGAKQLLLAVGAVLAAAVSWVLIEEPIRSGRRPRLPFPVLEPTRGALEWARSGRPQAFMATGATLGVLAIMTLGGLLVSGGLRSGNESRSLLDRTATSGSAARSAAGGSSAAVAVPVRWYGTSLGAQVTEDQDVADAEAGARGGGYAASLPESQPRTSCTSVVHIGDSTSDGLVLPSYQPNPANRIPARYKQIGVQNVHTEVVGGTSIVEEYDNQPNAQKVAARYRKSGYNGCWVLALGTNDTADVAAGSNVGVAMRIKRMMSTIGNQPVMWITVRSLLSTGDYSEQNMEKWNQALQAALPHYPNMRVYDWASVAQVPWFINDKIHYTTAGYAARGELIADALAAAFPANAATTATAGPSGQHSHAG